MNSENNSAHSFTEGADEGVPCIRGCKCYIPACVVAAKCVDSIPEVTIAIGKPGKSISFREALDKASRELPGYGYNSYADASFDLGLYDLAEEVQIFTTAAELYMQQAVTAYKNKLKEEVGKLAEDAADPGEGSNWSNFTQGELSALRIINRLIDEVKL